MLILIYCNVVKYKIIIEQLIRIIIEQKREEYKILRKMFIVLFLSNRVTNPTHEPEIMRKTLYSTDLTHFHGDSDRSHQIAIPTASTDSGDVPVRWGLQDRKLVRSCELDRESVYLVLL